MLKKTVKDRDSGGTKCDQGVETITIEGRTPRVAQPRPVGEACPVLPPSFKECTSNFMGGSKYLKV